ncbi:MAG: PadR family transcriptional regulator [Oscillatoria sp. SIO1A7]|nr:PadR family transcriptional regulator [Oscillatoria sp. SIO1A7]
MTLTHTILAAIASEPQTGYDLSKRFDDSVGFFWKASQQQIYRELAKMEDRGLLSSEIIPQVGRPAKKLYSLTEEGLRELKTWIVQPSDPMAIREDLLVKVMAGHLVSREEILQELQHRRQIHAQQLSIYRHKEKTIFGNLAKLPLEKQCLYLTLRRGILYEENWVAWCDEAIEILER